MNLSPRSFSTIVLLLSMLAGPISRADIWHHEPKVSYIDNGTIKLGVDLNLGGAITYVSLSGTDQNLVNSYDLGRQIQMSYYSGPVPFLVAGKKINPSWLGIGWNPIQVGDAFGNASKILANTNDGKSIYVKCTPMHWPLENVPGECTFECWLTLDGPVVHARARMVNNRPDKTQYPARTQELPAIYTNAPWYKLMTYAGDKPFSDDELTQIKNRLAQGHWGHWTATESWAALVDDQNFGLGVFEPGIVSFSGGFAGEPGKGGPADGPTGYIAPNAHEIIDWNIDHSYRYDLIVGKLPEIRRYVYAHAARPAPPAYRFDKSRAGWFFANASDTGWPIRGELNVLIEKPGPELIGPAGFWNAQDAKTLVIDAALRSRRNDARLWWHGLHDHFKDDQSLGFTLNNDGQYHTIKLDLADCPQWKGGITQIRIDPVGAGAPEEWIKIRSIRFE